MHHSILAAGCHFGSSVIQNGRQWILPAYRPTNPDWTRSPVELPSPFWGCAIFATDLFSKGGNPFVLIDTSWFQSLGVRASASARLENRLCELVDISRPKLECEHVDLTVRGHFDE